MKYKYQIGDLVIFQTPHMDIREWEKGETVPYQLGMITHRKKAGYKMTRSGRSQEIKNHYYHILLPTGETHYLQREDRLALAAKANP
jgi:hypothetical protein